MAIYDASELARRLSRQAEAVCREYLSAGRREGRYWIVGDIRNSPGRSLFVRLTGPESGKGAAGKWTDAATGEHGDLLDVIRASCGLDHFRDVLEEARAFLSLPRPETKPEQRQAIAARGSAAAARRLFAISRPIAGTLVETYLRTRGLRQLHETNWLRFHPCCYHRPHKRSPTQAFPAMIAAVTDLDGRITGAHRTWLSAAGNDKAPVETPRRAMGGLLGNAVRFGTARDVLAAGEGIETILSLRMVLPRMPMAAALSAAHLAAILFPPTLRRLYIARDSDPAGEAARDRLVQRAQAAGIEAIDLSPMLADHNEDLRLRGFDALCRSILVQLAPGDGDRFVQCGP